MDGLVGDTDMANLEVTDEGFIHGYSTRVGERRAIVAPTIAELGDFYEEVTGRDDFDESLVTKIIIEKDYG